MKILKGVAIYSLLILGILLVIAALLVGCMFLMPGFKLFGWALLAKNANITEVTSVNLAENSVYNVNIDANIYDVTINLRNDNSSKGVYIKQYDDMYGFYRPDNYTKEDLKTNVKVESVYNSDTKTTDKIINIAAPYYEATVTPRKSYLTISLPRLDNVYNLNIKTTSGDISIEGFEDYNFPLKKLEVNTDSGNVSFNNLRNVLVERIYKDGSYNDEIINSLKDKNLDNCFRYIPIEKILINSNKGDVDFRFESEVLNKTNVYLATVDYTDISSAGSIAGIESAINAKVSQYDAINLNIKKGDVNFDNLICNKFDLKGNDVLIRANKIKSLKEFYFNSPSGLFEIEKLESTLNTIITNNIGIKLGTIKGELSISTTYGNIEIDETTNNASLNSVHGNITVVHAKGSVSAITEYGNINVKYSGKAYFKNNHGITKVEFVMLDDAKSDADYNNTCDIITGNGSVEATNLCYETTITTSNGARVVAQFSEMYESSVEANDEQISMVVNHKINLNGGSATIKIPSLKAFMFKGAGSISGKIGSETMTATDDFKIILGETGNNKLAHLEVVATNANANFETYWK